MLSIPDLLQQAIRQHQAGNVPEAERLYRQVLQMDPRHVIAQHHLGVLACQAGRADLAEGFIREALRLSPDFAEGYNSLGIVLRELGRLDEAVLCWKKSLKLKANQTEPCNNLGLAYRELGQLDDAVIILKRALSINPSFFEAHNNLGNALKELGRLDEAVAAYQQTVRLKPDHADAHKNLGIIRLLMGNFPEGWAEFEWRWRCKEFSMPQVWQPLWNGAALNGQTILLHTEQGLGDTIQFIRYAPMIQQRGGRVLFLCPATLVRLMGRCRGVDWVYPGEPLPGFHVHAPLLSLPRLLGTMSLETIPANVPYIEAEPDLIERFRPRLQALPGLKIGIAWQGNPSNTRDRWRSLRAERFTALAKLPGVSVVSLQKGPGSEQVTDIPGLALNLAPELADFADTAAVLKNLDLLITVDTAVAHLAGALAVPVWMMVPFAPDWRWLLEREDSPWYPSMRLFRQRKRGDWGEVFSRVTQAVANQVQANRS